MKDITQKTNTEEIFVIAGSHHQFKQFEKQINRIFYANPKNDPFTLPFKLQYVNDCDFIRGLRGYLLIKYGTYYNKPNYDELIDRAILQNFTVIESDQFMDKLDDELKRK